MKSTAVTSCDSQGDFFFLLVRGSVCVATCRLCCVSRHSVHILYHCFTLLFSSVSLVRLINVNFLYTSLLVMFIQGLPSLVY